MKLLRRLTFLMVAILGFAFALRVAGLNKSLWIDEVGSYVLASSDDFVASARSDIHPPLYYALLRGAMKVTHSVPVLRLFSNLCGILTVGIFLKLPSRVGGLLAATFVACSPELIFNSQELRQYALLNLWLAIALLATLRLLDEPDSKPARLALLAASLLAVSTHLLAIFFITALGAALLLFQSERPVRKRVKSVALLLPALALLLFFRFLFLSQATKITTDWWIGPFSFQAAVKAFAAASGWEDLSWLAAAVGRHLAPIETPLLLLFAGGIGFVGWVAWSHRDRRSMAALFIAVAYWGTLLVYSWKGVNVVIARVLLPGMLPLFASIGLGLASCPQLRWRRGATTIAVALALLMTTPWMARFAWQPREDLRGFAGALRQAYAPGDGVVLLRGSLALRVYWPDFEKETQPLEIDLVAPAENFLEKLEQKISRLPPTTAFIVVYRDDRYFQQQAGVWREMETRLRRSGRQENSLWNRDFYHIVRFNSPVRE